MLYAVQYYTGRVRWVVYHRCRIRWVVYPRSRLGKMGGVSEVQVG